MVEIIDTTLPVVSVVVVTYNGSSYIENLIQSLQDQSYPQDKIEIIIVDNASTDNTVALIKNAYPEVKLFTLPHNIGFAAGNNYALKYAIGDYIALLNQDTICHKNWLLELVKHMIENPLIGACTSNMLFVAPDSSTVIDRQKLPDTLCFYDLTPFGYAHYRCIKNKDTITTIIISGCSFIIRRQIISLVGGLFDEDLWMYVEDTDLSLRIHNIGYKTLAVKDSVIYHFHKNDFSFKKKRISILSQALKNRIYVFFKNMTTPEFIIFYPPLLIGGIFKIFHFNMRPLQKIVYFIPFAFFSIYSMLCATFNLHKYKKKKNVIIKQRISDNFRILKLLLYKNQ